MTAIAAKPTLASGNITSIVGMTLGIVPLAGLAVSLVGLVRSFREHTHPGFAVIGVGIGLFSTALLVGIIVFTVWLTSMPGFESIQSASFSELEAWLRETFRPKPS